MSLHLRYTDAAQSEHRRQVKFLRLDLIWQTDKVLTSPFTGQKLNGLPIWKDESMVIGPTILDMMTRTIWLRETLPEEKRALIPAGQAGVAVWEFRDLATIWKKPDELKRSVKEITDLDRVRSVDHPFKVSMASGGHVTSLGEEFIMVKKNSTVSLSEIAFKLAIGMYGSFDSAYNQIAKMAAAEWESDLKRAQVLWRHVQQANGFLLEDSAIAALRPLSSVSQEVERLVLRQACSWLGVDPDIEYRRPPGRPQSDAGDEGQIIRVTINDANEMTGEMKKEFFGIPAGTDLSALGLRRLVELLGALRSEEHEIDADFLEAYLDAAAPNWREQGTAFMNEESSGIEAMPDPYEVLGVTRDTPLQEITQAYRRIMQKVHPDMANVSTWFAKVAAAAYRAIRLERGSE